jgi:HlyD family secretion protein
VSNKRKSLEASIKLKGVERNKYSEMKKAEIQMLEKNLTLQLEILERYQQLEESGAASELQFLSQRNTVEETRGRLMQDEGRSLPSVVCLGSTTCRAHESIG